MILKRTAALTATMALWGVTAGFSLSEAPVAAAGERPACNGANPQTCSAGVGIPGTKVGPKDYSGEVGGAIASLPPMCTPRMTLLPGMKADPVPVRVADWGPGPPWQAWPALDGGYGNFDPVEDPPEPGVSHYYVHYCTGRDGPSNGLNWVPGGGWDQPDPIPQPPTPEQVRDGLWNIVKALLVNPQVDLEPDQGIASILNVPTFVEIDNPQLSTLYTATVQGVSVWITTVPTNTLNPGEDGAPSVPCDEDGTAYTGGDPDAQAEAANGCVYTYTQHNPGWNGNVTISWNVRWGSNQAGSGPGTLDAADNVGGFVRIVDEVQTAVNEPGENEG